MLPGTADGEPGHEPRPPGSVPAYSDPQVAAGALARAATYGVQRLVRRG
jgi:hypothetical protein